MKIHISIGVKNLEKSIIFYSKLFDHKPSIIQSDYAQWNLEKINFSISDRKNYKNGIDHLGFDFKNAELFNKFRNKMSLENVSFVDNKDTSCCYSNSDKIWVEHEGIKWEFFYSKEKINTFYDKKNNNKCCPEKVECC